MSSLTDLFLPVPDDYAAGVASGANAVDAVGGAVANVISDINMIISFPFIVHGFESFFLVVKVKKKNVMFQIY